MFTPEFNYNRFGGKFATVDTTEFYIFWDENKVTVHNMTTESDVFKVNLDDETFGLCDVLLSETQITFLLSKKEVVETGDYSGNRFWEAQNTKEFTQLSVPFNFV